MDLRQQFSSLHRGPASVIWGLMGLLCSQSGGLMTPTSCNGGVVQQIGQYATKTANVNALNASKFSQLFF